MTAIPFPLGSHPGRQGQESAGRLINAFAEPLGPGAPAEAVIKRTPGLADFCLTPETGFRGQILVGSTLYAAWSGELFTVLSTGVETSVGVLSGTGPVYFARNNKSPTPDIVVVTENGAFTLTPTTITAFADLDLPQPNSVCFKDGYLFFGIGDGRCFASGLNAVTINALDFVRADASHDPLIRVIAFDQYLLICGVTSIEVYRNTGNPTGFPFSRAAVIPRGLVSPRAITGFEDGFNKALVWVSDDNAVHVLNGYTAVRISTPDIDRDIEGEAVKTNIEASCHLSGGHAFVTISGTSWTWEYNLTTQQWHEKKSYLGTRWRGTGNTVLAFGKWIIGDTASGNLLAISETTFKESGSPLIWEVESAPAKAFPQAFGVPRADFNFVTGTGLITGEEPMETEPRVSVSWSNDGGISWSSPLLRELGRQATSPRVTVARTGQASPKGRRWRLQVANAVYVGLMGGDMTTAT